VQTCALPISRLKGFCNLLGHPLLACPSLASDVVDDLSQPSANLRLRLTGWFRIYRSLTGHNLDSGPYPRGTQAQSSPCLQVRMFQLKFQFRQNVVGGPRSEEHTSELQSRFDLVCRLLLEKKK